MKFFRKSFNSFRSKDIENSMRRLLNIITGYSDIDLKRIHTEDDDISVKKPTWD